MTRVGEAILEFIRAPLHIPVSTVAAESVFLPPTPACKSNALKRAQWLETWMSPHQMVDFLGLMNDTKNVDTYLALEESG